MSGANDWEVVEVMPILDVGDLEEGVAYYERLGFEREWDYPSADAPTHVGLSFGSLNLMLARAEAPASKPPRQNLYFILKGIDAYHARLRSVLGDELPEVVEYDYGMRDFSVRDPWGHLLTFGESC